MCIDDLEKEIKIDKKRGTEREDAYENERLTSIMPSVNSSISLKC